MMTRRIIKLEPFNFDNSHNSFLWPEYFIFMWKMDPMSGLCLHYRPETVHNSTKDAYTFPCIITLIQPNSRLDLDQPLIPMN